MIDFKVVDCQRALPREKTQINLKSNQKQISKLNHNTNNSDSQSSDDKQNQEEESKAMNLLSNNNNKKMTSVKLPISKDYENMLKSQSNQPTLEVKNSSVNGDSSFLNPNVNAFPSRYDNFIQRKIFIGGLSPFIIESK